MAEKLPSVIMTAGVRVATFYELTGIVPETLLGRFGECDFGFLRTTSDDLRRGPPHKGISLSAGAPGHLPDSLP
jgi:hypothetical protein